LHAHTQSVLSNLVYYIFPFCGSLFYLTPHAVVPKPSVQMDELLPQIFLDHTMGYCVSPVNSPPPSTR
jgi:hypothetical protein